MAEAVKTEAIVEFTRYVDGYGMVVGSPDSTDEAAKYPMVPLHVLETFQRDGLIAGSPPAPQADAAPTTAKSKAP